MPLFSGIYLGKMSNIATVNAIKLSRLHPRPERRGLSLPEINCVSPIFVSQQSVVSNH
jgi:hypothetical protein